MSRITLLVGVISLVSSVVYTRTLPSTASTKPIDLANFDTTCTPCKDFYRFVNGTWLDRNPVPGEYSNWGAFSELAERNSEVLHQILEEAAKNTNAPKGSLVRMIGDFYASGMDSLAAEQYGVTPLEPELARIEAIKTKDDLATTLAFLHLSGNSPLFSFGPEADFKNSDMVIAWVYQSGLTLPDREYYTKTDERSENIKKEFRSYMKKMFGMLGDQGAEASAMRVYAVEERLAKASMSRVEQRNLEALYHKLTIPQMIDLAPAFNWKRYLAALKLADLREANVAQPNLIREMNAMLSDVPLSDWKTYLRWHVIHEAAPHLSSAFVNEHFHFTGTVLSGTKELKPRWKRVRDMADGLLGEALGQLYVEKAFPPAAKARANEMVKNLLVAMNEHIRKLDWMNDATRKQALTKLRSFTVKIGYPDKWKSYEGLQIDRGAYVLNVQRARMYEVQRELKKIDRPADRTEWGMTPPTVNAYYNPTKNEIVFPAGILQPPFFDANADDAVNYGGIGAVIGHEITHGFDDQGRKFDAKGNMTDWWTKEDGEKFEKKAAVINRQYEGYVAIDTLKVNGKLTLGENIADLGGLSIAYSALKKSMEGRPRPAAIDGFTPEQRFFLSWGTIWRRNYRDENLRQRLITDPHSPSVFRANGPLGNMPAFQEAFGCKQSDPMMRPRDDRAKIW